MNILLIALAILIVPSIIAILVINRISIKKTQNDVQNADYKRKYENADLKRNKVVFLSLGLVLAFGMSSFVLNYEFDEDPQLVELKKPVNIDDAIYEERVNTEQLDPPKPTMEVQVVEELIPEEIIEVEKEDEEEKDDDPEPEINFDDLGTPDANQGTSDVIEDNEVYFFVDKNAEFPGGTAALEKFMNRETNKRFTSHDREKLENLPRGSTVTVSYVIEKDGAISNIEVLRGVNYPSINEVVVESLNKLPKWTPAETNGYKVRLKFVQRIKLK